MPRNESVYSVRLGLRTHFLTIEELSAENGRSGRKYMVQIPANPEGEGKTICGSSELEAALNGAEFLLHRAKRHAETMAQDSTGMH